MTFEEWYADNVKFMHTKDSYQWLFEAWETSRLVEQKRILRACEDYEFNVQGLERQIRNYK